MAWVGRKLNIEEPQEWRQVTRSYNASMRVMFEGPKLRTLAGNRFCEFTVAQSNYWLLFILITIGQLACESDMCTTDNCGRQRWGNHEARQYLYKLIQRLFPGSAQFCHKLTKYQIRLYRLTAGKFSNGFIEKLQRIGEQSCAICNWGWFSYLAANLIRLTFTFLLFLWHLNIK